MGEELEVDRSETKAKPHGTRPVGLFKFASPVDPSTIDCSLAPVFPFLLPSRTSFMAHG